MFAASMPLFPEQASTMAIEVDRLFWFITLVTASTGFLVYLVLAAFCVRYRRSNSTGATPRILGSHQLELFWTITPLFVFLTFFGWGAWVYNKAMHAPADAPEIYVVGKQWMWKAQYSTGQRVIIGANTDGIEQADRRYIGALVLPVDKPVRLILTSEDVIHDFAVPAFRSKVDVVPGRYVSTWYHPIKTGEFHLFCDQYCGTEHSKMVGKVIVLEQEDYDNWLRGVSEGNGTGNPVDGSLAWSGSKLFLKLQCITCHTGNSLARAPALENLYKQRVPLYGGGTVLADDAYIRESILYPMKKVHEGWNPTIMPTFKGQVTEEDIIQLIAYIRSLKQGDIRRRTDLFPVPVGAPTGSKGEKQ